MRRSGEDGFVAQDGVEVPAGGASAATHHRSADRGVAANRPVKETSLTMHRRRMQWAVTMIVLAMGVSLSADRVKLRSGKVIEGMFMGADSKSVRILLDDGQVSEVPLADALAVEFSARKPAPPPPPPAPKPAPKPAAAAPAAAPAAASAPPPAPKPAPSKVVTVPAGTQINVRL